MTIAPNRLTTTLHALGNFFNDALFGTHAAADFEPTPKRLQRELLTHTPLWRWLPYDEYDPASGLFVNRDSIAIAFEVMPITGADDETAKRLHTLFTALPADTGLQILLYGSPNLEAELLAYQALRDTANAPDAVKAVTSDLIAAKIEHIRRGTRGPVFRNEPYTLRNLRAMVTITRPESLQSPGALTRLQSIRDATQHAFRAAEFVVTEVDPQGLIDFLYPILNPHRALQKTELAPPMRYDRSKPLCAQLQFPGTRVRAEADGLRVDDGSPESAIACRSFSVLSYPASAELWEMGGVIGDLANPLLQYPCPFLICMGAMVLDYEKAKLKAQMKTVRSRQNAKSQMAEYAPELQAQDRDWQLMMNHLTEGGSVVSMYHEIVLFAPPALIEEACQAADSIWKVRGFTLAENRMQHLVSLYSALPMTLTKDLFGDLKAFQRVSTKFDRNAIDTAPLLGEWRGTGRPVVLLFGRRGVPCLLDLFKGENYNAAIAGTSGSGKSVLANEIVFSYRSIGARIWIIDKGRSYERTVDYLGGEQLVFSLKDPVCINPFSWVTDFREWQQTLGPLVAKMAQAKEPYAVSLIGQAITLAWEAEGNAATITTVQSMLGTRFKNAAGHPDPVAHELGVRLSPFTKGGMYEPFFEGPATIDLDSDLIVLELDDLGNARDLQAVVMHLLMDRITYEMYRATNQGDGRSKICLIDEAVDLFRGADSADFIQAGYRRARKYDGAFITATQGISDYFEEEGIRAAYTNAHWKLILRQDPDVFGQLLERREVTLAPAEVALIKKLRMEKNKFSECLVRSSQGAALVRHMPSPELLALASSDAEVRAAYWALRDRADLSAREAIADLVGHIDELVAYARSVNQRLNRAVRTEGRAA